MPLPADVAALLRRENATAYFTIDGTRLKCALNGHCLPLNNSEVISSFVRCVRCHSACGISVLPTNRAGQRSLLEAVLSDKFTRNLS
jgi:hypothetical protein